MVGNGDSEVKKKSEQVPSVQERVRLDPSSVPQRYIRSEEDRAKDVILSALSDDIPIIYFSLLLSGQEEELKKLDSACEDWGFFQRSCRNIFSRVRKLGEELLGCLSLIMKMDKNALLGLHKDMFQTMGMNYYPTCCHPDQVLGARPHSDTTTITLLLQENDVVALQIQHGHGWVPVKPIPNSLMVNVGDPLEVWSNAKYKSIEHRVVSSKSRTQMSFPTFFAPQHDVEIGPLEEMLDVQQSTSKYKRLKFGDLLAKALQKKHGKAHVESIKDMSS